MEKTFLEHDAQFLPFQEELTEEEIHAFAHACVREGHDDPELLMDAIRNADPGLRAGLGHSFSKGEIEDETKILSEMEQPLAIFHGKEDQIINASWYDELSLPTLWQNKVHFIDQAGHSPQYENPQAFNRLLNDFLQDIT
jgi:pimeloyl-ACP methyl ester carboxylesterase